MASLATPISAITLPSDQDASGRTLGDEEVQFVTDAIRSGILTSTKGQFTRTLESRFAEYTGVQYAYACSSGTAAIHCAIAALNPEPGEEFITTSITDMGALTPILYQGGVPVFAEVDEHSLNVTAETIAPCISERTKAIIVTHLFGNPCDMDPILALAQKHNLPVIEDCAQAFGASYKGRMVGSLGTIGCFSTQQGKHMTTGEGGLVTTNDPALARRMFLFINKAWGYGDANPDHYFIALNYRMSELQGAVALAQSEKLKWVVDQRIRTAENLSNLLRDVSATKSGLTLPNPVKGAVHTYWKYILNVETARIPGGAVALSAFLKNCGISSAPRYIQKPSFECEIFRDQRTFGNSRFPFSLARPEALRYDRKLFPKTISALENVLVLPWNERYEDEHVNYIAQCVKEGVETLCWNQRSN